MLEQQKTRSGHLPGLVRVFIQIAEIFTFHASAELASFDHCLTHSVTLTNVSLVR
jgi:hypothetical protein